MAPGAHLTDKELLMLAQKSDTTAFTVGQVLIWTGNNACSNHLDHGQKVNFREFALDLPGHADVHTCCGTSRIVPVAELIDVTGWRRWPASRIEAVMERIDDSTELWDLMGDELDKRDHEHDVRVLNGGVLP